jgi:hypothetical protein
MDAIVHIDTEEADFRRAVATYYGVGFYDVLIRGDRVHVNMVPYVNEARTDVAAKLQAEG